MHSDLHEPKVAAVFDYLSSMIAISEPVVPIPDGERLSLEDLSMQEQNFRKGKFSVRLKRRNGRVRLMVTSLCTLSLGHSLKKVVLKFYIFCIDILHC